MTSQISKIFLLNIAVILLLNFPATPKAVDYENSRQESEKFIEAYHTVDRIFKGQRGKSRELQQLVEFGRNHFGHDEFTENWNRLLEMECLPTAMDLRTKVKNNVEYDWIQRYMTVCYNRYILFNWDLINESIAKRLEQINDPNFLKH